MCIFSQIRSFSYDKLRFFVGNDRNNTIPYQRVYYSFQVVSTASNINETDNTRINSRIFSVFDFLVWKSSKKYINTKCWTTRTFNSTPYSVLTCVLHHLKFTHLLSDSLDKSTLPSVQLYKSVKNRQSSSYFQCRT